MTLPPGKLRGRTPAPDGEGASLCLCSARGPPASAVPTGVQDGGQPGHPFTPRGGFQGAQGRVPRKRSPPVAGHLSTPGKAPQRESRALPGSGLAPWAPGAQRAPACLPALRCRPQPRGQSSTGPGPLGLRAVPAPQPGVSPACAFCRAGWLALGAAPGSPGCREHEEGAPGSDGHASDRSPAPPFSPSLGRALGPTGSRFRERATPQPLLHTHCTRVCLGPGGSPRVPGFTPWVSSACDQTPLVHLLLNPIRRPSGTGDSTRKVVPTCLGEAV